MSSSESGAATSQHEQRVIAPFDSDEFCRAALRKRRIESPSRFSDDVVTDVVGSVTTPQSKSCCFCWCCCCSCSWYKSEEKVQQQRGVVDAQANGSGITQNGEESKSVHENSSMRSESEDSPSYEEVLSWSHSFEKLIKSSKGRRLFREFLRLEYSEENIQFYQACEELRQETDPVVIEDKARVIYEDFISILSPREVSLDSKVRELINDRMAAPDQTVFDEAQLQIYTLMHRDSWPRFVASAPYKKLLESLRTG